MELVHLHPLDFKLESKASLDSLSPLELALVQFHLDTTPSLTHHARRIWHQKRLRAPQTELDAFSSTSALGAAQSSSARPVDQQVDDWRRGRGSYGNATLHRPSHQQEMPDDYEALLGVLSAEARRGNTQPLAREIEYEWCRRTGRDDRDFLDHTAAAQEAGLVERWSDSKSGDWMELAGEGPPRPAPSRLASPQPTLTSSNFHLADLDFPIPSELSTLTSVQLLGLQFRDDFPLGEVIDSKLGLTGAEVIEEIWFKRATKDKRHGQQWVEAPKPSPLVALILEPDTPPDTPRLSPPRSSRRGDLRSRSRSPPRRRSSTSSSSTHYPSAARPPHRRPASLSAPLAGPALHWRPDDTRPSRILTLSQYIPSNTSEPLPPSIGSSFYILRITGIPYYLRSAKHLCEYLPSSLDPDGVHKGARDEKQTSGTIEAWLLYSDFDRAEDAYHFINRPLLITKNGHPPKPLRAEREHSTPPLLWSDIRRDLRDRYRKQMGEHGRGGARGPTETSGRHLAPRLSRTLAILRSAPLLDN